jgi:hypothetical protein
MRTLWICALVLAAGCGGATSPVGLSDDEARHNNNNPPPPPPSNPGGGAASCVDQCVQQNPNGGSSLSSCIEQCVGPTTTATTTTATTADPRQIAMEIHTCIDQCFHTHSSTASLSQLGDCIETCVRDGLAMLPNGGGAGGAGGGHGSGGNGSPCDVAACTQDCEAQNANDVNALAECIEDCAQAVSSPSGSGACGSGGGSTGGGSTGGGSTGGGGSASPCDVATCIGDCETQNANDASALAQCVDDCAQDAANAAANGTCGTARSGGSGTTCIEDCVAMNPNDANALLACIRQCP